MSRPTHCFSVRKFFQELRVEFGGVGQLLGLTFAEDLTQVCSRTDHVLFTRRGEQHAEVMHHEERQIQTEALG